MQQIWQHRNSILLIQIIACVLVNVTSWEINQLSVLIFDKPNFGFEGKTGLRLRRNITEPKSTFFQNRPLEAGKTDVRFRITEYSRRPSTSSTITIRDGVVNSNRCNNNRTVLNLH